MATRISRAVSTKKAVLERIRSSQDALLRAKEYLRSGDHADWHGFRPVFRAKSRVGKVLPPHKDWIRNVFIPRMERSLTHAEKLLERLE
jgi:hypothetical protein